MNKLRNSRRKIFELQFFVLWLALVALPNSNTLLATNSSDSIYYAIEAKYHYGIFIPHHNDLVYQIKDYIQGGEINILRTRYHTGLWENGFNRIETGIGLWYGTFGNNDVFGRGVALYPFLNFHLLQLGKFNAKARLAFGAGYVNKLFSMAENPFNTLFGSHINAYIGLGLMFYLPATKKLLLTGGIGVNHLSNGSIRKPNNGVNTAFVSAGVRYSLVSAPEPFPQKIKQLALTKRQLLLTFSAGRNQAAHYNPQKYWSGSFTATHLWNISKNTALGGGIDFIKYGGAPYAHIRYQHLNLHAQYGFADEFYAGAFITSEFHFGTTAIYLSPSVYLHSGTKPPQPLYARMGIRQKLHRNIIAHFGIKASFFVAEFVEFGIGYRLNCGNR